MWFEKFIDFFLSCLFLVCYIFLPNSYSKNNLSGCCGTCLQSQHSQGEGKKDQEFKVIISYIVSLKLARTVWNPISKKNRNKTKLGTTLIINLLLCKTSESARNKVFKKCMSHVKHMHFIGIFCTRCCCMLCLKTEKNCAEYWCFTKKWLNKY